MESKLLKRNISQVYLSLVPILVLVIAKGWQLLTLIPSLLAARPGPTLPSKDN
jgi:hypothetical protein